MLEVVLFSDVMVGALGGAETLTEKFFLTQNLIQMHCLVPIFINQMP